MLRKEQEKNLALQEKLEKYRSAVETLREQLTDLNLFNAKLLYVNHNDNSHPERIGIKDLFRDEYWSNVDEQRVDYYHFLLNPIL